MSSGEASRYPSVEDALDAANVVLQLAPETNGEVAHAAFRAEEKKTGLALTDLAEGNRNVRTTFGDLAAQPIRHADEPDLDGDVNDGRAYAAWVLNVERLVPWRTLAGRQHLYVDHPLLHRLRRAVADVQAEAQPAGHRRHRQEPDRPGLPRPQLHHPARQVAHPLHLRRHASHADALARDRAVLDQRQGCRADRDRRQRLGRGLQRQRGHGHARGGLVPRADGHLHDLPRSRADADDAEVAGSRRRSGAARTTSLTRTRINPVQLAGGYAQFTYGFNYWGPIGVFTRDTYAVVKKLERLEW